MRVCLYYEYCNLMSNTCYTLPKAPPPLQRYHTLVSYCFCTRLYQCRSFLMLCFSPLHVMTCDFHAHCTALEVELKELVNPSVARLTDEPFRGRDQTCAPDGCRGQLTRVSLNSFVPYLPRCSVVHGITLSLSDGDSSLLAADVTVYNGTP